MIEIRRLPPERWEDYKKIRLQALKTDSQAFGSSYEEEVLLSEVDWIRRIENAIFALEKNEIVGTIVIFYERGLKTRHIASIYGFYVAPEYRGKGIAKKLLAAALEEIRKRGGILKAKLAVNSEQKVAIKVYEDAGFVLAGRMKKELLVDGRFYDELAMEKMI